MISSKLLSKYSNRGMDLEEDINITNDYYLNNDIACIHKKPTPITVVSVDYRLKPARIKEGYFNIPSTTDYNGIYKGKYIDFEAKETKLEYFPLKNIHAHQIEHLKKCYNMGGISFVIIKFTKYDKVYLIKINELLEFYNNKKNIPYEYFKNSNYEIKYKYNPRLDYLSIIDKLEDL